MHGTEYVPRDGRSTLFFSHSPVVRQQNQLRSYSLEIVFFQTDPKPAKVKIPMTYER